MEDLIIDLGWGTKVEVYFNEYNHKTKKRKQVERTVTRSHERAIGNELDSTDSGTFLEERVGDVTLFGYFELI
jgi:hypothetical protein